MNYTGPKIRLARRLGLGTTPKSARYLERRPYPPGQHGPRLASRRGSVSGYKLQLLEKQKLRVLYNISERQLLRYFEQAAAGRVNTGDALLQSLETRLDAAVMRGGLARTIYAARQLVSHGHILVNSRPVTIPSCRLRPGDRISVAERSRRNPGILQALEWSTFIPPYLSREVEAMTVTLLHPPRPEEVPVQVDLAQVIEFYSR